MIRKHLELLPLLGGGLDDIPMHVGNVVCSMVFLVVDIDTYDLLLGLNFLLKIGAMVNVEK